MVRSSLNNPVGWQVLHRALHQLGKRHSCKRLYTQASDQRDTYFAYLDKLGALFETLDGACLLFALCKRRDNFVDHLRVEGSQ